MPVCSYSDEKRVHLEGCGQFSTMVGPTSYTCEVMGMKNMVSRIINHPQGGINHYIKMGDFLKAGS